ncbi:MAG: hypothetical protein AAF730_11010 [Bacteroidota bacterium]
MRHLATVLVGFLLIGCIAQGDGQDGTPKVTIVATERVEALQASLPPDVPKVDIGVYVPQTDDPRYTSRVPMEMLLQRLDYAKAVYAEVGVDLNVLWIKTFAVADTTWLTIPANVMQGEARGDYPVLYAKMHDQQTALAPKAEALFDALIAPDPLNDRTIYLVGLRDVYMAYYEQDEEGAWSLTSDPVNALSFPTYLYEDRIPKRLRGVISMQNLFISQKVLAHEFGHKLINVSHEYGLLAPQHEIDAEGGLMVYGEGVDIPSGREGRWHLERLMQSPFLYRIGADGARTYNPEYQAHGRYDDPLYRAHILME